MIRTNTFRKDTFFQKDIEQIAFPAAADACDYFHKAILLTSNQLI